MMRYDDIYHHPHQYHSYMKIIINIIIIIVEILQKTRKDEALSAGVQKEPR